MPTSQMKLLEYHVTCFFLHLEIDNYRLLDSPWLCALIIAPRFNRFYASAFQKCPFRRIYGFSNRQVGEQGAIRKEPDYPLFLAERGPMGYVLPASVRW